MISRRGRKAGALIELVLILAGFGLLTKAVLTGTATYRFIHLAQPIDGIVTGLGKYGLSLYVQITPGSDQSAVFLQDGFLFGYQMGDTVPALYDPANINHAAVDSWSAIWFDAMMYGIAGFVLTFFGFRLRSDRNI